MNGNYGKFRRLLEELFQLDHADLNFGIYRIMNQKRDEIMRFLDDDLLPQVQEAFQEYRGVDRANVEAELDKAIQQARSLGVDPDAIPKVQELRGRLSQAVDVAKLENEVFSDLYDFFRRYYHEGDFLSLRRYKEGVYGIPYEGEEVKLHWANHDQYYVKTSEYFRDYTFKLPSGKRVHFKLAEADTEKDNQKAEAGKERRFILCEEEPLVEVDGELHIRFEYGPDPGKSKQDALNNTAFETILNMPGLSGWKAELAQPMPTPGNPNRTLLEKHLNDYTARNTFDYFIHKDLGGFLRRELDFYIKNEIMHLDDIENESAPRVEQYLSKIKVIRKIAHKIIQFLAQIEDFQKKLWLKKKFVVETNYCVTLDRIPKELLDVILQNEAQIAEWKDFYALDEILEQDGLFNRGLTIDSLKRHQNLVLDTINFPEDFKLRLLSSFEDLGKAVDGTLIKSENLQGLRLLLAEYRGQVKCIYIDPPYNTGNDEFIYKDNYQHSCWLSMMFDRLLLAYDLLHPSGTIGISIDNNELENLLALMDILFGRENRRAIITVKRGSVTGPKVINPGVVNIAEFLVIYSKSKSGWNPNRVYRERQRDKRYSSFIINRDQDPSKWVFTSALQAFADFKGIPKTKLRKVLGDDYEKELDEFILSHADAVMQPGPLDITKRSKEAIELKRKSESDPDTVYRLQRDGYDDLYIVGGKRILFYSDRLINIGSRLVQGEPITDICDDTLPNDLHNEGGVTLKKGKKPEKLVGRLIELATSGKELVVDFFVGSGTACAAAQKMGRKWIGIEMDDLFDPTLKRRLKNTLFGESSGISSTRSWSGGGFLSYQKLEGYEDTLNNLELKRTNEQQSLLKESDSFRENYMLSYMLDVESNGSSSLLSIDAFEDPFNNKLKIATGSAGETKPVTVDLVETFNYLVGLTVHHIDHIRGFRVVQGTSPEGEKVLVIWRNLQDKSNEDLEEFFRKQEYNPKDMEFDLIYVNGDNNLENIRRPDETWKVRLIEEDFKRLMFEVEDI